MTEGWGWSGKYSQDVIHERRIEKFKYIIAAATTKETHTLWWDRWLNVLSVCSLSSRTSVQIPSTLANTQA